MKRTADIPEPVQRLLPRALEPWLCLSVKDAGLLVSMMRGETLKQISVRTGIGPQGVFARWKKIIRKDARWKAVATGMIGSGRGRKPGKADGDE